MYKFSFFIIVLFLAIQPSAFAGVEGSVKRFSSSDLVVNSVLKVQDNKYPDAPGKSVLVNSKGNVRLGIDFSKNPLSPFTVEVYVSITKYSNANPSTFTVKSETLKVENNATLHATHIDQNVFKCDNASRIEVTILQINVSGNAPIPPSVYLQADIQTERYYKIDPLSVYPKGNLFNKPLDVSIPLDGISDELQVSWANIAGVEEYDLEWTYVNNYVGTMDNTGTPDFIAPKNLSYSFRHNATRVRVNKNSYNIPLVYEHGYILYRLRSVGRDLSDPTKIITGLWSSDLSTGAVVSTNASEGIVGNFTERYQIVNAKETNKNWQYAATYAEDGKKKEVVSYFDGSSRSRQSVTKSNTENLTIVGETVYDYQGRPAIQILPVPTPTEEKEIKFYDKFNVNGLGKRYSRLDFDLGADCVPPTGLMNSTSGASNYYSSDNTNKDGAQAFVPDAEKFPFTQIEYTPDNTGRIGRQSGVGPNHKLGSNHEIKYFYGQPEQQQLDRLFGSEVGNYNRYKKNMVVDANGQVSVSYLDSKGKVIATSLVARGAVNTAALASNPAVAQELTYTYIDHGKGKGGTEQGNALVFSKELLVTVAGNFTLDYSFVTPFYNTSDACSTLCMACTYDVELSLKNACGVEQLPLALQSMKKKGTFSLPSFACAAPYTFNISDVVAAPVQVNLQELGAYTFSKRLTIRQTDINDYVDAYMKSTCLKGFNFFLAQERAKIDYTSCDPKNCDQCKASLGTEQDFISKKGVSLELPFAPEYHKAQLEYKKALRDCAAPCRVVSGCDVSYQMMLKDVSPLGQYGKYKVINSVYTADDNLSVFNEVNILRTSAGKVINWRNPETDYLNEFDELDYVKIKKNNDNTYYPEISQDGINSLNGVVPDAQGLYNMQPKYLNRLQDFIFYFQASWAKSLVKAHPEYLSYEWCSKNSDPSITMAQYSTKIPNLTSDQFDSQLLKVSKYADAESGLGLGNKSKANTLFDLFTYDPFFNAQGAVGAQFASQMAAKLTNYAIGNGGAPVYNIKQIVSGSVRCGTIYYMDPTSPASQNAECDNFGGGSFTEQDKDWLGYRGLYLSLKQNFQKIASFNYVTANGGITIPTGKTKRFPTGNDAISNPQGNTAPSFKGFNLDIYSEDPATVVSALKNVVDYNLFIKTSQCPLARDLEVLLNEFSLRGTLISAVSIPLKDYPQFTKGIYDNITDPAHYSTPFIRYVWSSSLTNSTTLSGTLADGLGANANVKCANINLTLTDKVPTWWNASSWNKIQNIYHLRVDKLPVNNSFTFLASVPDDKGVLTELKFGGSTCIQISTCTFGDVSIPSPFATDVVALWNALLKPQPFDFGSTSAIALQSPPAPAVASPYNALFTSNFTQILGPGTWSWKKTSTPNTFEISDETSTSTGNKLQFVFTLPTAITDYKQIIDFSFFRKSTLANQYVVVAHYYDNSTNPLIGQFYKPVNSVDMNLTVNFITPSSTTSQPMTVTQPPAIDPCQPSAEFVSNGNFSSEVPLYKSDYVNYSPCYNLPQGSPCFKSGQYTIAYNPTLYNENLFGKDHTTGNGSFLIVNGYKDATKVVWTQSFSVVASSNYSFSAWVSSLVAKGRTDVCSANGATALPANLSLTINGVTIDPSFAAPDNINVWKPWTATWNSGTATTATIAIYDNSLHDFGNSFGLDDISFLGMKCNGGGDIVLKPVPTKPFVDPCRENLERRAIMNASQAYDGYLKKTKAELIEGYMSTCKGVVENLNVKYLDAEHHFTLYYYDQAGNLIKTVPPAGVVLVTDFVNTEADRVNNTHTVLTHHRLETNYEYNSLNQLIRQAVPDNIKVKNWSIASIGNLPAGLNIYKTLFSDALNGFAVGEDPAAATSSTTKGVIYQTSDGGTTWAPISAIGTATINKIAMAPTNALIGYAVGVKGTFLKTIDGGLSWSIITAGTVEDLNDLYFSNETTGVVVGNNGLIKWTQDGGATWTNATGFIGAASNSAAITGNITGLSFSTSQIGCASVSNTSFGNVYKTKDGGRTWSVKSQIRAPRLLDVVYLNDNTGFTVGDQTIFMTIDAGINWKEIYKSDGLQIKKMHFKDVNTGCLLMADGSISSFVNTANVWSATNSIAVGSGNTDMVFYNGAFGFAFGNGNQLFRTFDGGLTWAALTPLPTLGFNLKGCSFVSDNNVFILDNNGTLYNSLNSKDKDPVWIKYNAGLPGTALIHFFTPNDGIVVNPNGGILKISNATLPNVKTAALFGSEVFADMNFLSATEGYLLSNSGSVKYTKDAINWIALANINPTVSNGMLRISSYKSTLSNGISVVGDGGDLFKYNNVGYNWINQSGNLLIQNLKDLSFNGSKGMAVGVNGEMLTSTDLGENWQITKINVLNSYTHTALILKGNYNAVSFVDNLNAIIVGENGKILNSIDGGKNWDIPTAITPTPSDNVNYTDIVSYNSGFGLNTYITGSNQTILASADLTKWSNISPSGPTYQLNGFALSNTNFIAVGENGAIIRSTNNGTQWTTQTNIILPKINNISSNGTYIYAVANEGKIFRSINGGLNWSIANSGTTANLKAVSFTSDGQNGIVTGAGGVVLKTVDFGATWALTTFSGAINAVQYVNASTAIIVGDGGAIYKTTNNGSTWSSNLNTGNTKNLNALFMVNATYGFAAGASGTIVRSLDGGSTWAVLPNTHTTETLTSIYFKDAYFGYAAGTNNTIIRTVNQGNEWYTETGTTAGGTINSITPAGDNILISGNADARLSMLSDVSDRYSSRFWYDRLGRLVASQNAKQLSQTPKAYSYTKYDVLGRIAEVGELSSNIPPDANIVNNPTFPDNLNTIRRQVTRTYYDAPICTDGGTHCAAVAAKFGVNGQENLRKRVSATAYYENFSGASTLNYDFGTYYTYDVHGNVKTLVQDNRDASLTLETDKVKSISYGYDLVSGKVNTVDYQPGARDQFHHRYEYDADNRIIHVLTSKDSVIWDEDAKYFYYKHGPLARTELGDQKVQGVDYAYTIQGWIKGVNSNSLDMNRDMGKDGTKGALYASTMNNIHNKIAADAYGYSLNYFDQNSVGATTDDYKPIGTLTSNFLATNTSIGATSLYNGNIAAMGTSMLNATDGTQVPAQLTKYGYDQLNRLQQMTASEKANLATDNSWTGGSSDARYQMNLTYDANGNILSMDRNGKGGQLEMDHLTYKYDRDANGNIKSNKLYNVNDVALSTYTDDIKQMPAFTSDSATVNISNNYGYDAIGNLIKDKQEEIGSIEWNVYGKITKVNRITGSSKSNLEFKYDAAGNRISKAVIHTNGDVDRTYYVRDATGNIMSTYTKNTLGTSATASIILQEQNIYGSSRVGIIKRNLDMTPIPLNYYSERTLGTKQYELTNHLGNVLATVSDRKIPVASTAVIGDIEYYTADIISSQDYYAFGMIMPGRSYSSPSYRYGFNGKEKTDEITGVSGADYDFGARMYDARLGRWWEIDPKFTKYPNISPYAFSYCNPIVFEDPDGKDPREAGKEVPINFTKCRVITAKETESFRNTVFSSNDPKLFAKAMFTQEAIETIVTFPFEKIGLSELAKQAAKAIDPEYKEEMDNLESFQNAAFADSYIFREYGGHKDQLFTKMTDRVVKNLGKGFEASVTLKTEYDITYKKDKNGKIVAVKTRASDTVFTLEESKDKGGKIVRQWNIKTTNYNANGSIKSTFTRKTKADPVNKNTK